MSVVDLDMPPLPPFPTVDVHIRDRVVATPCQMFGDHIAVTPDFHMDSEGVGWLTGRFTVIHVPTGWQITTSAGCVKCARRAAGTLATCGADWSTLTPDNMAVWATALPERAGVAIGEVKDLAFDCSAEYCEDPPTLDSDGKPLWGVFVAGPHDFVGCRDRAHAEEVAGQITAAMKYFEDARPDKPIPESDFPEGSRMVATVVMWTGSAEAHAASLAALEAEGGYQP